MARYIFKLNPDNMELVRPYRFPVAPPGSGAAAQYGKGKVYQAIPGMESTGEGESMNVSGQNDWYGRQVFSDLLLISTEDQAQFINALITVEQTKTIVQTALQGRNGSVMEYVAMASHIITISGSFFGQEYPKGNIEELVRILQMPEALTVKSDFLAMFGIYEMVCNYYKFPQETASEHRQGFEIKFLSHENQELILE